jgi:hypothetical protein
MSQTSAGLLAANQSLLQYAADSLGPSPNLTEAERKIRGEAVTDAITAFLPDDPLQTMLASEAIGFHLSIMDGFREINSLPMTRAESSRARMVAVAQTKMVLALVRELRIARKDALAAVEPESAAAQADAAFQVSLGEFQSAYADTLATLEQVRPLDPETAGRAMAALDKTVVPALAALNVTPAQSPQAQVSGSRAHRRAVMKQRGAFRKAS